MTARTATTAAHAARSSATLVFALLVTATQRLDAAETAFVGTASQVLQRVSHPEGEAQSLARITFEGLVTTCNQQRAAFYDAPALRPAEDMLRRLDAQRIEKYFDNGRAATHVFSTLLSLPDLQRWQAELRAGAGTKPARPPDCSQVQSKEHHTATLWLGGVKYELNYDLGRGTARRGSIDFTRRQLLSDRDFDAAPSHQESGQWCREVALPALDFLSGRPCIWTAFPPAAWLNFPWVLRAERRFGAPGKLVSVDTLIGIERNRAIPADKITVPKDFIVAGPR